MTGQTTSKWDMYVYNTNQFSGSFRGVSMDFETNREVRDV